MLLRTLMTLVLLMALPLHCSGHARGEEVQESAATRVLLLTGGHGFDEKEFFEMFGAMEGLSVTHVAWPAAVELLKPGLREQYDCVVTYDMCQQELTPEQKTDFVALMKQGMPYVALHHNLGAHRNWPEYAEIIGGKYIFQAGEYGGRHYDVTPWEHDNQLSIAVVDREHPVTQGIDDFTIHDETYGRFYVKDGVHVLLTTDHPKNNREVAWTTSYGKSPVCYIMLGHDKAAYRHPAYPKLVRQAIAWAVSEVE